MPEPTTQRTLNLQLPEVALLALKAVIAAVVVAALAFGRDILMPLALAALLAFLLDPLVGRLRRLRLPRAAAVGAVTVATVAAVVVGSYLVAGQVVQLGRNLPQYQNTIESKLRTLRRSVEGQRSLNGVARLLGSVEAEVDKTRKALHETAAPAAQAQPLRVEVTSAQKPPLQGLQELLTPVLEPLVTAGIVVVLLVFILLERNDIRDRVMRLAGGELHDMTDAVNEAAKRVSRYLRMQLLVNVTYGVPLALGLWLLGVPGALLWGALAAVLRFVPYLGPVLAAVFPLAMAFAIDPGWQLLLWTLALVAALELISNNIIEPWLYGSSTGLAPVAVLLSASFWTVLWGPVGLVLATPLTVCLVVIGRHIDGLRFLDLLLGSQPVFDTPTRLYQRLLAGNVELALEIAESEVADKGIVGFYTDSALPALARVAADHNRLSSAQHRLRVRAGMAQLLRELRRDHGAPAVGPGLVQCFGLRWEADTLAATMAADALGTLGVPADAQPAPHLGVDMLTQRGLSGTSVILLSTFHPRPEALVRYACRRLQRAQPGLRIVLGLWNAPPALCEPGAATNLGAAAVATSLSEAVDRIKSLLDEDAGPQAIQSQAEAGHENEAAASDGQALARALEPSRGTVAALAVQRVGEVFDVDHAVVQWADGRRHAWQAHPELPGPDLVALDAALLQPVLQQGQPTVVPDLARDPRVALPPDTPAGAHRFLAAVPLRWRDGQLVGVLCLLHREPRSFEWDDLDLLEGLARDMVRRLQRHAPRPAEAPRRSGVPALMRSLVGAGP